MFHTHLPQWDSLSNTDIHYIKKIMKAMPTEIEWLYFPIVYPSINIRSYIARKLKEEIIIVEDKIEIVWMISILRKAVAFLWYDNLEDFMTPMVVGKYADGKEK